MSVFVAVLVGFSCLRLSLGLENGLARTPPMGWTTWERFRCITDCEKYPNDCICEKLMKEIADRMAEDGYLSAGYEYLIIGDCWLAEERDSNGNLRPDPERFPSGMKSLSDYIHSKGLKFGMYGNTGRTTCAGYPGMAGHLEQDAELFASWDVDYVKVDGCYTDVTELDNAFIEFGNQLLKTQRPMVYSCTWPVYITRKGIMPNYTLIAEHCNLWRVYENVGDSWNGVTKVIDFCATHHCEFSKNAGPGHWNDPDLLVIGDYGLNYEQAKAQMAMWSILAAPLIMSNDLRNIKPEFRDILLNEGAIAINQDKLGIQGQLKYKSPNIEVWTKPLEPVGAGSWAVAVLSKGNDEEYQIVSIHLRKIGLDYNKNYQFNEVFQAVEPFQVPAGKKLEVRIPPTSAFLFKVDAQS